MKFMCVADCTGDPVVNGQKVRTGFRRGWVYEDLDLSGPWKRYFRFLTEQEEEAYRAAPKFPEKPQYLIPVEAPQPEVNPLFYGLKNH